MIATYKQFNQIKDNLWMGGTPAACASMPEEFSAFKTIVNVYPWESYELLDGQVSIQAKMYDSMKLPDREFVDQLASDVLRAMERGPVLVHCQQGWNRSGLIVARALMLGGMKAKDAIALIRERRMQECLCNPVFEAWLISFDEPENAAWSV